MKGNENVVDTLSTLVMIRGKYTLVMIGGGIYENNRKCNKIMPCVDFFNVAVLKKFYEVVC